MIKKTYRKSVNTIITQAYLFHREFLAYKNEFIQFSADFQDPFAENFLAMINKADSTPTYQNDCRLSTIFKIELDNSLLESRKIYMKLVSHIRILYPKSKAILNFFGRNLYDRVTHKPLGMHKLLHIAYNQANSEKYKSDLIDSGFSQIDIDGLLSSANLLNENYLRHLEYMQNSYLSKDMRIEQLNKIWYEMKKIHNASKVIFSSSPEMKKIFEMY